MQKTIYHRYFSSFYRCFTTQQICNNKSASSSVWLDRQSRDPFTRDAKVEKYLARSAYKLIELNRKHKLLKRGLTVVDLGYSPGSWSQVAVEKVKSTGKVIGVDLIPTTPPPGVIGIQGDFFDPTVQQTILKRVVNPRDKFPIVENRKVVDLVLSDMMVNTSGIEVRDHQLSMDLCDAALLFCADTLKPNGSFVCKFYSGPQDSDLENRIRMLFRIVKREKPEACRKLSKEAYFVALQRKGDVSSQDIVF